MLKEHKNTNNCIFVCMISFLESKNSLKLKGLNS